MNKIYKKDTIVPKPKETMTVTWDQKQQKKIFPQRGDQAREHNICLKNINPSWSISINTNEMY